MFDLRYHVASLAAVFLALIIGILVGAGLAARTDVEASERRVLEDRIDDLERSNRAQSDQLDLLRRQNAATEEYVEKSYAVVMDGRLRGMNIVLLFVGPSDDDALNAVEQTLEDAGAPALVEMEALALPVNEERIDAAIRPQTPGLALDEVGRRLASELIGGGETPYWDALTPVLVQDHRGASSSEADAVILSQTDVAADTPTRLFLDGLYAGLAGGGVPVVGVEQTNQRPSRIAVYQTRGISSVDSVDTQVGRVALAALLAGAAEGHYGVKRTARNGPLPAIEPLPLAPPPGG